MKTASFKIALIATAGSLTAMAAPAQAAEMTLDANVAFAPSHTTTAIPTLDMVANYDGPRYRYDDDDDWDDDDDYYERRRDRRYSDRRYRDRRVYDSRGRYYEPRRIRRGDRIWRGRDGRYYCQRENGTTGLIIGAGVGALLGRAIDTRGDRTVGTLLGGALGAVLGREIDRGDMRCR